MDRDLLLGANHDLAIINTDFTLTDDNQVIAQRVTRALLLFKGEYFLNQDIGMPYYEDILGSKNSLDSLQAIFINAVYEVEGVAEVKEFDIAFDNASRTLTINMTIEDIFNNEINITI